MTTATHHRMMPLPLAPAVVHHVTTLQGALRLYPRAALVSLAEERISGWPLDYPPAHATTATLVHYLAPVLLDEAVTLWTDCGVGPAGTTQQENEPDASYRVRYWYTFVAAVAEGDFND